MIRSVDIAEFLRVEGVAGELAAPTVAHATRILPDDDTPEGELPAQPDRLVAVRITGGGRTLRERTFDQPHVQVVARGMPGSQADAEALAAVADNALMGAVPPLALGGRRVISVEYVGGPPTFVTRDEARRSVYSCNYVMQVDREVF